MSQKVKIELYEVWEKYEDIAMHFNDLILKIRVQALGAVTAVIAIASLFSDTATGIPWGVATTIFGFLSLFWAALWFLDFQYYNRLLIGAVDELLKIEKLSQTQNYVHQLNLSTNISKKVRKKVDSNLNLEGTLSGPKYFYLVVLVGLLFGFIWSLCKYF